MLKIDARLSRLVYDTSAGAFRTNPAGVVIGVITTVINTYMARELLKHFHAVFEELVHDFRECFDGHRRRSAWENVKGDVAVVGQVHIEVFRLV